MFEQALVDPDADVVAALGDQWAREWVAQLTREDHDPDGDEYGSPGPGSQPSPEGSTAGADAFVAAILQVGPGAWAASALSSVDQAELSEAGRLDLLGAWQAQVAWAEAQLAAVLVGHVGVQPLETTAVTDRHDVPRRMRLYEAALALRLSEASVRSRWQVARDLATRLPSTRRALADGSITWMHARAVSDAVAVLDDPGAESVDAHVMRDPQSLTPATLRRRLRTAVSRQDPEASAARLRRAHAGRTVERHGDPDGLACLQVWSDPRDIQAMWKALTVLAGPRDADDPRTLGARRVDALLAMCLAATGPFGETATDDAVGGRAPRRQGPPIEVQVVVDLATLLGLAENPAELRGHGPIPAGVLSDWLSDATTWRRLVTDPVTGHLLDYGTAVRFAPPKLRAFLAARDQTCRFPGCHQPADRADADHHPPWRPDGSGGRTSTGDLGCLCERHHGWKTHHGWTLERRPDGVSRWTSPSGRSYDTLRRPVLDWLPADT